MLDVQRKITGLSADVWSSSVRLKNLQPSNNGTTAMRTMDHWRRFLRLMLSPRICGNALRVSLVVGTVLNVINQGEHMLAGQGVMLGHAALNFLVPFLVASYSCARAVPIAVSDSQPPAQRDPDGS